MLLEPDNPEAEILYYKGKQVTGKPVAQNSKGWVQPLAHGASSSVYKESLKDTEATWKHYLQISSHTSHNMEAVFSMGRKIYGKQPGDPMEDLICYLVNVHEYHSSSSGSSRKRQ